MKTKTLPSIGTVFHRFTTLAAAAFIASAAQANAVYVGNSLTVPNGGADGIAPLVILGEYNQAGPLAASAVTLPAGTVDDVQFYGNNYNFTLYALSLVGSDPGLDGQTFQVTASESFSGSAPTGVHTLAVSDFSVKAGDLLAFSGIGPYYPQNPNDAPNSDATYGDGNLTFSGYPSAFSATPPGGAGTEFTVGTSYDPNATYDYIPDYFGNQGRDYGIGVDVSSSVPDSSSTVALFAPALAALAVMKRRSLATA